METREEKLQKAAAVFVARYDEWLKSQEGQRDAYQYEATFVDMMNEVSREAFQTSVESSKKVSKKKVATRSGTIQVPSDHILFPQKGKPKASPYWQDMCLFVGQEHPFDQAQKTLEKLTNQEVTAKQIERLCHHYGEQVQEVITEELEEIPDDQVGYGMVDGCYIQVREQGWKEVKVGRFFNSGSLLAENEKRNYIESSRYVAHLGHAEEFKKKVESICKQDTKRIWIADGARWIWDWLEEHFPGHQQILDYFHSSSKLHEFAYLAIIREWKRQKWKEEQEQLLLEGKVEEVIEAVKLLKVKGKAREKQQDLIRYYTENRERMRYGEYRAKGWLIGSGPIESAHRTVVQQRLKCSGQRWTSEGAQQLLNLKVAYKSGQWHKVVELLAA